MRLLSSARLARVPSRSCGPTVTVPSAGFGTSGLMVVELRCSPFDPQSTRRPLPSTGLPTNTACATDWTAPGRRGRSSSCARAIGRCLLLEDAGGEPLDGLLGAAMELGLGLRLAIGIVSALGKAHQRGLFHKDVKPANILVSRENVEVRLTGFGIASRLPRERQAPEPPETIAGTLAYMAPEQTGRMNRSIDARSDLYALGVTLYQMLTGVLPFTATDPLEWVHCHIARKPVSPHDRLATIPAAVSAIVMKLLAKTAEETLPDRGRRRARSASLPESMGNAGPDRSISARRMRHPRPADDPRETLRARARDRDPARRLRACRR